MRGDPVLKSIPVMAVTAYAGQEDEARIRAAGANAYVTKPISVMRFAETVDQLLDARRPDSAASGEARDEAGSN